MFTFFVPLGFSRTKEIILSRLLQLGVLSTQSLRLSMKGNAVVSANDPFCPPKCFLVNCDILSIVVDALTHRMDVISIW